MRLLTDELRKRLPPLRGTDREPDPLVLARFHAPGMDWDWLVTEGSPFGDDFMFFGFVRKIEGEWIYFRLSDLESPEHPKVVRDAVFEEKRFSQIDR